MIKDLKQIEFGSSPDGKVTVLQDGKIFYLEEKDHDFIEEIAKLIEKQYPRAWKALSINYRSSEKNAWHYLYLRVSRFILCNMGKVDGLQYDIDNGILHIEDINCPMRSECPWNGVVCHPQAFNLTEREEEIVKLRAKGETYKDISRKLHIENSTVKNILQSARKRLSLFSAKDLTKLVASIL